MKNFAVGCWSFEPVRRFEWVSNWTSPNSSVDFTNLLKNELSNIPEITELQFSKNLKFINSYSTPDFKELDAAKWIVENSRFTPHPVAGSITFRIIIPENFDYGRYRSSTSAIYKVQMHFSRTAPIVVVGQLDVDDNNARRGLILVREFLRKTFLESGSSITLRALGPTPFPCEFSLNAESNWPNSKVVELYDFTIIKSKFFGSNQIGLLNKSKSKSKKELMGSIFISNLIDELREFYDSVEERRTHDRKARQLEFETMSIITRKREQNFLGLSNLRPKHLKQRRNLLLDLAELKLKKISSEREYESQTNFLFHNGEDGILNEFIEDQILAKSVALEEDFEKVINMLDNKRENTINLTAAWLLTVFTTIFTMWLQSHL